MLGYITPDYYKNEFKGLEVPEGELERYIERASDAVDQVTNYVLYGRELERFAMFIQDQVKKATAAQVEYFVVNGGPVSVGELSQVSAGNFSYTEKDGGGKSKRVSPEALNYLRPTGLLYRGIEVYG